MTQKVLRGRVLSFNDAPKARDDQDCYTYLEDGALLIEGGVIVARGAFADVKAQAQDSVEMVDHRPHIITAGFIDTHIHFPQMQVLALTQARFWSG